MAESPEHQYLSETFLSVLDNFAHSDLYTYRESERGKFDFACVLSETWEYLVNGQTLWKHTEGIDKDLRTLLVASDAPLVAYVARDTTKHRATFYESLQDYRRSSHAAQSRHLKVFWVPADFDADSESARRLVETQLKQEVTEDILFNVLFGKLSAPRVRAILLGSGMVGLELAVLHSIATEGFFNFARLSEKLNAGKGTLRDRVQRLQMSGLLIQPHSLAQMYHVGSAGRAFLRLCSQVNSAKSADHPLSVESTEILRMLGIEPDPAAIENYPYYFTKIGGFTPPAMFSLMSHIATAAEATWGVDWAHADFKHDPGEQDQSRWLLL
jgi:hypothetical protein